MEHNKQEILLNVNGINVNYGKIAALKEVSIYLKENEIVAIIGANGAGKTTLVNSISGIHKIQKGEICFQNKIINKLPAWRIARKGIIQIPEGRRIFPKLTVKENLELGAFAENKIKEIKKSMEEMFEMFPFLKERKEQSAGTLSGGEQQMLAIARGMMSKPKLLMFDEPSMGLAPTIVDKVFQVIKQINSQGVTILLIEQNAKKSLQIADRAYVLETGNIVLADTGEKLLENEAVKKAYLGNG